jgi:hypothetical protein
MPRNMLIAVVCFVTKIAVSCNDWLLCAAVYAKAVVCLKFCSILEQQGTGCQGVCYRCSLFKKTRYPGKDRLMDAKAYTKEGCNFDY